MTLKNNLRSKKAQAVLEYSILFAIMLAALIASGLLTRVGDIFRNHFVDASNSIIGDTGTGGTGE